jgi:hypothetical protein
LISWQVLAAFGDALQLCSDCSCKEAAWAPKAGPAQGDGGATRRNMAQHETLLIRFGALTSHCAVRSVARIIGDPVATTGLRIAGKLRPLFFRVFACRFPVSAAHPMSHAVARLRTSAWQGHQAFSIVALVPNVARLPGDPAIACVPGGPKVEAVPACAC